MDYSEERKSVLITHVKYKMLTKILQTLVTMSAYSLHMDPDVFPDPHKFNPERWLSEDPDLRMERNLVPFLKGSRNCIGMK
jgi:cytochrome P450